MNPNLKCHDLSDSFMRLISQSLVIYDTHRIFERFQKLGIRGYFILRKNIHENQCLFDS